MATRTNLITNPSFEVAGTWTGIEGTSNGSLAATVPSADRGYIGAASAKLVNTAAGDDDYLRFILNGLTAGVTYNVSAYAYLSAFTAQAAGSRAILIFSSPSTTNVTVASLTTTTTGIWVRYDCNTTISAGESQMEIRLYSPQGTIYWDNVLVEPNIAPGVYFDGSVFIAGYTDAWTGTAQASTSTQVQNLHNQAMSGMGT